MGSIVIVDVDSVTEVLNTSLLFLSIVYPLVSRVNTKNAKKK